MDNQYIILAFVLTLIGVSGVVLFNGKTPVGGECNCIIPSPENTAMQGTSGVLLIFGVMFIPIGVLKGGLPGKRTTAPVGETAKSGRQYNPVWMSSGGEFAFGIVMLIAGAFGIVASTDYAAQSNELIGAGALFAILGAVLVYRGSKIRKQQS